MLIDSGVVSYHDAQTGIIRGVPDLKYFLKSQDPIKWGLVEGAALIFLVFWLIKAAQFHGFCKFVGVRGTFTQHARAYLEGVGVNRLLPFNQGDRPDGAFMGAQGAPGDRVSQAAFLGGALRRHRDRRLRRVRPVRPRLVGVARPDLLVARHPRAVLPAGAPEPAVPRAVDHPAALETRSKRASGRSRAARWTFSKLTMLSLLAFGLEDIAAYMIAMAFTSTHVILNVNFSILLMAIVASYIARLIPVTPGGIGQFEWGFAAGLYLGGAGLARVRDDRGPRQLRPLRLGHAPVGLGLHPARRLLLRGPQARRAAHAGRLASGAED